MSKITLKIGTRTNYTDTGQRLDVDTKDIKVFDFDMNYARMIVRDAGGAIFIGSCVYNGILTGLEDSRYVPIKELSKILWYEPRNYLPIR